MTSPKLRFKEFREEWKLYKLKDKACFLAGYAFDSNKMDSKEGKYQLLKMSNVYQNQLDLTRNPSYWHDIDKSYERWLLERGDIVLTLTGTVGKKDYGYSIEVPESNKFLLNQRLVRLRQIDGEALSKFIKYRISTDRFFYHFFNISKGGTGNQSNVSIEDLKLIEVNFPNIDEQIKIASFLTSVDKKISQLNEKHQLMLQYKKGVMQKIFSQEIRFKDDNGEDFGEWEEKTLGNVVDVFDNLRVPVTSSERITGKTPYYGANGIQDYVEGYTHKGEFVLLAEDGANDLINYPVCYVNGQIWVNNHAHVLSGKSGVLNNRFLTYRIASMNISNYLVGGSRAKLNGSTMKTIKLYLPTFKEQTEIANFLTSIDDKINNLFEQLQTVKEWKKGLLQQMFV